MRWNICIILQKETQICSPKLGITAISVGSHLPFHYWCYWTMVINIYINLDSSKCQIYLFHFVLLKALDKLQIWKLLTSQTWTIACVSLKVQV